MIEIDLHLPLDRFALEVALNSAAKAIAILGPSGCGKTSLLEAIAGLRRRATGRIYLDGDVLLDSSTGVNLKPERRRIGYVPQDAALFPHLTVRANVRFGLKPAAEAERRFAHAVSMLEIGPLLARFPATLSGGERQRVALARAVATAPRLLLLDEPLAALDVELKERIFPYLLRIRDEAGVGLIYVTHDIGEATVFAREAVLLRDGRVEAHGRPVDVLDPSRLVAFDSRTSLDNVIDGTVARRDQDGTIRLTASDGVSLVVPAEKDLEAGSRASYCVPAEDIMISIHPLTGVSARNVLEARIAGIDRVEDNVIVRLHSAGLEWRAKLTAASVPDLGLAKDRTVWLAIKSNAFRRLH